MVSKGIAEAHGSFRRSVRYHSDTNFDSTGHTESDGVKKHYRSPFLEGIKKPTGLKGEYNCFTATQFPLFSSAPHHFAILLFHHVNMYVYSVHHFRILLAIYLCSNPFHHITISPCECGCVFSSPFHHFRFTLALYQSISPFQQFTFSPLFHNFTAKRP